MGCTNSQENDRDKVGFGENVTTVTKEREIQANAAAQFMGLEVTWSIIELSVSCSNLTRRDKLSESDPFCVLFTDDPESPGTWKELARTEIIANSASPKWVSKFIIQYQFEIVQKLMFEVYDCDTSFSTSSAENMDLSKQDFLGRFETTIVGIMGSPKRKLLGELDGGDMLNSPFGSILIVAEEVTNATDEIQLKLECTDVRSDNSVLFVRPFLMISKLNEDGSYVSCYRTEVSTESVNPSFAEIKGPVVRLVNGDMYRPLKIVLYDWNASGKHSYLGEVTCSLEVLRDSFEQQTDLPLLNEVKIAKYGPNIPCNGKLKISNYKITEKASFLDFFNGGLQLQFIVAIDFTASNGSPNDPQSLHYCTGTAKKRFRNPYIDAINSIGSVLEFYDYDKRFPCYGFGAKLSNDGVVNHCFPLGDDDDEESCAVGVNGVIDLYKANVSKVIFAGPTVFANVLYKVCKLAKSFVQASVQQYIVLLILTDGAINDMQNSVDALVAASKLPISVIIIGVGDANFEDMVQLDADKKRLVDRKGNIAERDLVQFTALKLFDEKKMNNNAVSPKKILHSEAQTMISRDVLAEIPCQVTQYFESQGIKPKVPLTPMNNPTNNSRDAAAFGHSHYREILDPVPILQMPPIPHLVINSSSDASSHNGELPPSYSFVKREDEIRGQLPPAPPQTEYS